MSTQPENTACVEPTGTCTAKACVDAGKSVYLYAWAALVYVAFAVMLLLFRGMTHPQPADTLCTLPMTLVEAGVFTLPLLWLSPRRRWTLWPVIFLLGIFMFVNGVYLGRFNSFMPYTTMFWVGNVDSMVVSAALRGLGFGDGVTLYVPLLLLGAWLGYFRRRIAGQTFAKGFRRKALIAVVATVIPAQTLMAARFYAVKTSYDRQAASVPAFLGAFGDKIRGIHQDRVDYFRYNGLLMYAFWNLRDFSPGMTLSDSDKARIADFVATQKKLDASHPLPAAIPPASERHPNFLLIMVESLESWAVDFEYGGVKAMPVLDSLINKAPGTLYYPDIYSQISLGTSSDGHLIDITGLLPLRDYAVSEDFADNAFPSIFDAFSRLGYHTFELTCDQPQMWNQQNTWRPWGFKQYLNVADVDPDGKSTWKNRDKYLGDFLCKFLPGLAQPWAGMAVTLSLHSPYHTDESGLKLYDGSGINQNTVNYLRTASMDDICIGRVVRALKEAGIYDNTIIAVTGDHMAVGLGGSARPATEAGRSGCIPLVIINSTLPSARVKGAAAQSDIYPTLLDVCGLHDYPWRGLGLSLLRHGPHGALNRALGLSGKPTAAEITRQSEAWEVSRLILTGNFFDTPEGRAILDARP